MKLVIKDNKVFATHSDEQDIVCLYPDCEIVYVPNNTVIDEERNDPRLSMDIADVKTYRIVDLKNKINHDILAEYPLYKQLNIIRLGSGYTEDDKTSMSTFIDAFRDVSDELEAEINNAESIEAILAVVL